MGAGFSAAGLWVGRTGSWGCWRVSISSSPETLSFSAIVMEVRVWCVEVELGVGGSVWRRALLAGSAKQSSR